MNRTLITTREAAELAGVTPRTIARWRRSGRLPAAEGTSYWRPRYQESDVRGLAGRTRRKLEIAGQGGALGKTLDG